RLNLSQQKQEQVQEHFLLALAEIDNEVIGIPLEQVREFVVFDQFFPVPFSPDFILGNINLRSEIVTLINIRALMGLPTQGQAKNKAIVTQSHNSNVAIAVDEIRNITDVDLVSVKLSKEATQGVMGTAILENEVITIIDLPDLLSKV
ncbi:MAG: chemotaxis protein CheW, partial [Pseudanabaenaceae cyanobacterium]